MVTPANHSAPKLDGWTCECSNQSQMNSVRILLSFYLIMLQSCVLGEKDKNFFFFFILLVLFRLLPVHGQ